MSSAADPSPVSHPSPTGRNETPTPNAGRLDDWEAHLCAPFTGRKVICAFEVLAGMTGLVDLVQRWGAQRPLLIADGFGTGPLPDTADADVLVLEPPAVDSVTEEVRARLSPEQRLTSQVIAAVKHYDPEGEALWWLNPIPHNSPLLGRAVWGGRPPHQVTLEDKLLIDDLLADIDAPKVGSVNARATYDDLTTATEHLLSFTSGTQAVWPGDSRDGINDGADYVRWIQTPEQAQEAADFFARYCDQVRVSPFLEGVPCSIHGIVLPDGVVVLRPVELAILRDVRQGRFVEAGMGTTWEPPPQDTRAMRELARSFGLNLQRRFAYRGGFGLDGVLTAEGFRVTELNPRFSGGLTRLARCAPKAQLQLVHLNALVGRDVGRSANEIEAEALHPLEAKRFQEAVGWSDALHTMETQTVPVRVVSGRLEAISQRADPTEERSIGSVLCGPSSVGTFVRLVPDAADPPDDTTEPIPHRAAELARLLLDFADRTWDTQFGPLTAAPDVTIRGGPVV